ncbi:MAG: OmpA family protein [Bacteroidales bacterium]
MKHIITILIIICCFNNGFSQQNYSTQNKKAIKLYEDALVEFDRFNYSVGSNLMLKAIKADNSFIEAYLVLAEVSTEQNKYNEAIEYYYKAIKVNPDFFPSMYLSLAKLEMYQIRFESAKNNIKSFLTYTNTSKQKQSEAKNLLKICEFAIQAMNNPVPFNPINLGDSINSTYSEYWPSLTADGTKLVITRMLPIKNAENEPVTQFNTPEEFIANNPEGVNKVFELFQEDFYISVKENNTWKYAMEIGAPIKTNQSEGAQSLTSDGLLMYFTVCNRGNTNRRCDIYQSVEVDGNWTEPINLESPVNTEYWEAQPSISPDGKTLYFVSDRNGGFGGKDIWMSNKLSENTWSNPVNLGSIINTPRDEQSPFIHFDNQTLYFSSNGHIGLGGSDLFKAEKLTNGEWSEPVNLGYPINTNFDEIGLIVNAQGTNAYFSSDRYANKGRDIFEFELYPAARPKAVSYIKGKVFDSESLIALNAKFELIELSSGVLVMQSESNKHTGDFLICIPTNNDYMLNVSKDGYLFYSDNFSLKGIFEISNPYLKDVALDKIKQGNRIILKNIFYKSDSYQLEEISQNELNKLVEFLNNNPSIRIEISGHTDNVGSNEYNMNLSENRAKSVYNYLVDKNIDVKRLVYKGYGEQIPLDTNNTDEGRATNRRTEIKIL